MLAPRVLVPLLAEAMPESILALAERGAELATVALTGYTAISSSADLRDDIRDAVLAGLRCIYGGFSSFQGDVLTAYDAFTQCLSCFPAEVVLSIVVPRVTLTKPERERAALALCQLVARARFPPVALLDLFESCIGTAWTIADGREQVPNLAFILGTGPALFQPQQPTDLQARYLLDLFDIAVRILTSESSARDPESCVLQLNRALAVIALYAASFGEAELLGLIAPPLSRLTAGPPFLIATDALVAVLPQALGSFLAKPKTKGIAGSVVTAVTRLQQQGPTDAVMEILDAVVDAVQV
jgi:hypothetical protein